MEAAVRFGVRVKSVATAAKMGTGLIITRRVIPPPAPHCSPPSVSP